MTPRKVEDFLRAQYSELSPEIKKVLFQLQTDVAHLLLDVTLGLEHHERIQIEPRAKECESAIGALLRRIEGRTTPSMPSCPASRSPLPKPRPPTA